MTNQEANTETVELNVFDDGRWHMKVVGVPIAAAPKRLRELRAALEAQGFTPAARAAVTAEAHGPACPEHGPAKVAPSKFGSGVYCKARTGDNTYCKWTSEPQPLRVAVSS
jgi:hypothetical protein